MVEVAAMPCGAILELHLTLCTAGPLTASVLRSRPQSFPNVAHSIATKTAIEQFFDFCRPRYALPFFAEITRFYYAFPLRPLPHIRTSKQGMTLVSPSYPPQVQFYIDRTGDPQTNYDFSFF